MELFGVVADGSLYSGKTSELLISYFPIAITTNVNDIPTVTHTHTQQQQTNDDIFIWIIKYHCLVTTESMKKLSVVG